MLPRTLLSQIFRSLFSSQATRRKSLTRRPGLELLEDRDVPSVTPLHLYDLNGTLADQMGGPALTSHGGVLTAERYEFNPNQGLELTGGLADTSNYSIVLGANLNTTAGFFKKVIDFQARAHDAGLYVVGSQLQLFPGGPGTGLVAANLDFQITLTRDGVTGITRIYLNGVLSQTYSGLASNAAIPGGNVLTFFEDDFVTRTEAVAGSVDYIAIYGRPLTDAEVGELAISPPSAAPTLSVLQATISVNEGQIADTTGTWTNAVSLSASIGEVTQLADGTWSWSFAATDGPNQSQTVTITAVGSGGSSTTTSFQLTVNNVAPTASSANNGPITYGQDAIVSFANQRDDSSADTTAGFRYAYSLTGDFTGITYSSGSSTDATQIFAGLAAGDHTVFARIIDKDNGFTPVSTVVSVGKAQLSVTADARSKVYDGAVFTAFTATISGFVNGDNSSVVSGNAGFGGPAVTATNAGEYVITPTLGTLSAANYDFTFVSGVLTITKAPTTTTAVGGTFTYDGQAHGGSGSVNVPGGVVAIRYVGINGTHYDSTAAPINAGSYSVIATYAGDANHAGSSGSALLIINPKRLSVSAWSQGTINIGSNGSIVLHLAVDGGQFYNADSVASLFNGATFTVKIQNADGATTYATLTSVATVQSDGSITVSMQMSDALRAELYDAYVSGRAVNFNMTATSNGGNYFLDEDTMSGLLNNGALRYVV